MERDCHICGTHCIESCPTCTANFPRRPDAKTMTAEERATELELLIGPLEIDFDLLHKRIEELVGRSVWTHELAYPELLVEEIRSNHRASFSDVIGKIPTGKRIIVDNSPTPMTPAQFASRWHAAASEEE